MATKGIDLEIQEVIKKLNAVKGVFKGEEYKEILASGAEVAKEAIQAEAPISGEAHIVKDGGGSFKKVKPGNLRKSIQVFSFKKSNAAFAGVVTSKKAKVKKIKGHKLTRRFRAFYWRFVYYGAYNQAPNRFIDRARNKSKGQVISTIKSATQRQLPKRLKKIFK